MIEPSIQCLILACGNTLREDDGLGPWLAAWAEDRFRNQPSVRVISRHQWTPELAADIAEAEAVLFIDCAANGNPGRIEAVPVAPGSDSPTLGTHQLDASQLLHLSRELYGRTLRRARLLTIGAASTELREGFSDAVRDALPEACRQIALTINSWLSGEEMP
jgi:hydrogenase maturation protease